jgi:hypothetical protein
MKKTLATFAVIALALTTVRADVMDAWDVSGHGSPFDPTLGATTIAPNLSTAPGLNTLSRTTVNGTSANNSFNSNNWNTGAFDQNTNYISFTIQPNSGFSVTLTSLDYAMNGSNTAPRAGMWGYSIAGGSFVFQSQFSLLNAAPASLSTWDFSDFTTNQQVEFRFWAFGTTPIGTGSASSTGGTVRIANIAGDDLILNGSVIPEPATVALLGVGLLGVVSFVRRRARRIG